jgi:hypothetical protein
MDSINLPDHRRNSDYEYSEADELKLLREKNKQLREIIIHLSTIAIKNVVDRK